MTLSVSVLGSGSKGNSTLIRDDSFVLLIDNGFSGKELEKRLALQGVHGKDIDAILISHEHNDHIKGVRIVANRYNIPVYANKSCIAASDLVDIPELVNTISAGDSFMLGPFEISPFTVSHDSVDPLGFVVKKEKNSIACVTDLGFVSNLITEKLKGCKLVILEANHDLEMLRNGTYSWSLKQRVMGKFGHLSNASMADALRDIIGHGLEHVFLAHLSDENNHPEIAFSEAMRVKEDMSSDIAITVTSQLKPTELIEL